MNENEVVIILTNAAIDCKYGDYNTTTITRSYTIIMKKKQFEEFSKNYELTSIPEKILYYALYSGGFSAMGYPKDIYIHTFNTHLITKDTFNNEWVMGLIEGSVEEFGHNPFSTIVSFISDRNMWVVQSFSEPQYSVLSLLTNTQYKLITIGLPADEVHRMLPRIEHVDYVHRNITDILPFDNRIDVIVDFVKAHHKPFNMEYSLLLGGQLSSIDICMKLVQLTNLINANVYFTFQGNLLRLKSTSEMNRAYEIITLNTPKK